MQVIQKTDVELGLEELWLSTLNSWCDVCAEWPEADKAQFLPTMPVAS